MKIIYISGIDGCGKTTQSKRVVDWLRSNGLSAEYQWLRWEPSVISAIRAIRDLLATKKGELVNNDKLSVREDAGQMMWDNLKKKILSNSFVKRIWLVYATQDYYRAFKKARYTWKSDYVVMDRYLFDFTVDQAINLGVDPEVLKERLKRTCISKMDQSDYAIIIDLPAKVGYERKMDGTSLSYLKQREGFYGKCRISDEILHVDGTKSIEEINNTICKWLTDKLGVGYE